LAQAILNGQSIARALQSCFCSIMGCSHSAAPASVSVKIKFHDRYVLGALIGGGTLGEVCLAQTRSTKQPQAVKILDLRVDKSTRGAPIDEKLAAAAMSECEMLRCIGSHTNVVELREVFFESNLGYLVFEPCVCNLSTRIDEYIERDSGFHRVFREMLQGLAHVHAAGIVHRDVTPHNFLLGGPTGHTVKLAAFDVAVAMPDKGMLLEEAGTCPFMSPEMLDGSGYDFKTDLWSLGVTAYLLLFGRLPYETPADREDCPAAMRHVLANRRSPLSFEPVDENWPRHNRVAVQFASALLQRHKQQRCSAQEGLALPYLSTIKPVAREEYLGRRRDIELRNALYRAVASPQSKRANGRAHGRRILTRLQSSLSVRSFRRSLTGVGGGGSQNGDGPPSRPLTPTATGGSINVDATPNISGDDIQNGQVPDGSEADDVSTSASLSDAPESPQLLQPLGKYKKMI